MRTRTTGIQLTPDGRDVDKRYRGERIKQRLGHVSQDEAEAWLRQQQADVDARRKNELRTGDEQLFAAAAQRYLIECQQRKVRTLDTIAYHISLLLPYIGSLPLQAVSDDSLEAFKEDRLVRVDRHTGKDLPNTPTTVNRSLEVARTILNRAARVWRSDGRPWLAAAPLIEMLDENRRQPYPINQAQQRRLLPQLPGHLQRMVLFAINTGARDDNVCGLRWDWEVPVPECGRSVFVIPPEHFKGDRHHVLILNDVAWRVIERERGKHPEWVFVWRREREVNLDKAPVMPYTRIKSMNNTAFQRARQAAQLGSLRVHDLRHTYAQRLRDAGVSEEDRALLLGHAIDGMPQHYAAATVARLIEQANRVQDVQDRTTVLRLVQQAAASEAGKVTRKVTREKKTG